MMGPILLRQSQKVVLAAQGLQCRGTSLIKNTTPP